MNFVSLIAKIFTRKGLLPVLGMSLLFGTTQYKTRELAPSDNNESPKTYVLPAGDTQKEKFINSLSATEGIEGNLDLTVSFKDKGGTGSNSYVKVEDAALKLAKPTNNVFALDLNMSIDYNGVSKAAKVNYVDDIAYVNVDNLKYKYSDATYKSVVSKIISIFGVDAIKVPDSFYDLIDSLSNVGSEESSFEFVEESSEAELSYAVNLNGGSIHFEADSSYSLTRVYSDKLTINDINLSFEFITTRNDDELTVIRNLIPADKASYHEVYDSLDLLRKIHNIVSSERFGISFSGVLHHDIAATNHHDAGEEDVKLDMSAFADLKTMDFNGVISALPSDNLSARNDIEFVSEKENEEQKTYINYNDVMRVAITNTTLNDLMARIKDDFSTGFNIIDKLLDLLDENFVSNIKNGRYQDLLGCLKSLSNDEQYVVLTLNLGGLGLGENSEVKIKVDTSSNNDFATITLNNVGLSGFCFNDTTIKVIDYEKSDIKDKAEYYFLEKIPTIYDQIYDIYSSPKFHLTIDGTFADGNGVGLSSISGSANLLGHSSDDSLYEFDGGYVDLELTQQLGKTDSDGNYTEPGDTKRHHIKLDLDKMETAYFHYYDSDLYTNDNENGTLGKISIEPFQSIVDIIKEIYNSNDERFSKWFKVIEGAASSNVIDALKTGKYSPLLGQNLIVSSSFKAKSSEITLSGKAFGLNDSDNDNDFTVALEYKDNEIESISIKNLVFDGKTLNLKLTISEYIEGKLNIIDHDTITTDFTGFSPLISDLYNTANLKTFHLTAKDLGISLKFIGLSLINIKLDMDFRIFVDGSVVKVYGIINVPRSALYTETYSLNVFTGVRADKYRVCTFYYDDIDPETGKAYADNSGYAYMTYNESNSKNDQSGGKYNGAYKYHSSYFQDTENLMHFIFEDVMDLKEDYYSSLTSSITKKEDSGQAINFEKLITNFSYDETNRKWDLGIAIEVLLNDDTLNNLTASIYSEKSSANNCYVASKLTLSMKLLNPSTIGGTISGTIENADLDQSDNWSSVNETYQTYIDAHRGDATTY